jgi:hypothetical protein
MAINIRCVATFGCLVLTACARSISNQLEQGQPARVVLTSYTPDQARDCVTAVDPAHFISTPIPGGWKVIDREMGLDEQPLFVVTITPAPQGSRVAYWQGNPQVIGTVPVAPCLDKLPPA